MGTLTDSIKDAIKVIQDKDSRLYAVSGSFHNSLGATFADAIFWYYMEQYQRCEMTGRKDLIDQINEEHDQG